MTEARIQIVEPTIPKTIEGKIIQADRQQMRVILDEPTYAEKLLLNHPVAAWVVGTKGVYRVSAILTAKQENGICLQFRKAAKGERRAATRYPCKMMVETRKAVSDEINPPWQPAIATNISHTGINLIMETACPPGTKLELLFGWSGTISLSES